MIRVLVVDDELQVLETLVDQIKQEGGYDAQGASSLADARSLLLSMDPELVILDVNLEDGDGRDFCRWMRQSGYTIPVLMLTAESGEHATIDGLEAGANDYIAKPLRIGELITRMRLHLQQHKASSAARLTMGKFYFSVGHKTLTHSESGEVIPLTEKETALLKFLYDRRDAPVGKKELLERVWGYGERVTTHTLETHIYRLRQKVSRVETTPLIVTAADGGYQLKQG